MTASANKLEKKEIFIENNPNEMMVCCDNDISKDEEFDLAFHILQKYT